MLVEWGEDNGGELKIPATVSLDDLIDAASEGNVDLLNAVKFKGPESDCSVQAVVREIRTTKRFACREMPAETVQSCIPRRGRVRETERNLRGRHGQTSVPHLTNCRAR
jgi:hypothetical protein